DADDDYGAPDFDDYYEPPPPAAPLSPKAAKSPRKVVNCAPNVEVKAEVKKEVETMEVEQSSIVDDVEPAPKPVEPAPKPTPQVMLSAADWDDSQETTDERSVEVVAGSEAFYVKEDDQQMIRMYWLDAFEDPVKHSGTVYLFGRVNVSGNKWASCCVTVKNIFRQVFFLPRDTDDDDDYGAPDFDDYYEPPPLAVPLSPKAAKSPRKVVNSTPSVEVKAEVKKEVEEMEVEQSSTVDDTKPVTKSTPQVMLSAADWDDSQETADEPAVEVVAGSEAFYVKEDGQQMIRMYWLDAFEDPVKHSGTVYLFGRVNVSGNKWASCCVTVKNIFRQVFFLPRDTKFVRGTSTNEQVKDADVFEEVKVMMKRHCGTASFKCR
ncbi:hypothetical protein ANCDUO_18122, partial [Ancylostoma duodenale]